MFCAALIAVVAFSTCVPAVQACGRTLRPVRGDVQLLSADGPVCRKDGYGADVGD